MVQFPEIKSQYDKDKFEEYEKYFTQITTEHISNLISNISIEFGIDLHELIEFQIKLALESQIQ